MINWKLGGRNGSIRKWVRREVKNHLHGNPVARREQYNFGVKFLRMFLGERSFGSFVALYFQINLAVGLSEAFISRQHNLLPQSWLSIAKIQGAATTIRDLSSNFLAVQIGILGLVSLALALVTLIAQRDNSSTDVRVYYHEAIAFELVASGIALLSVMCAQFFWPLQVLAHQLGFGVDFPIFETVLLGIHFIWLLLNLCGTAHFIATTLGFVQGSEREKIRKRYTVNYVQPRDLTKRLHTHLYQSAISNSLSSDAGCGVFFGIPPGEQAVVEIQKEVLYPTYLFDVRMVWVRWVLLRWAKRCKEDPCSSTGSLDPVLWFTPNFGQTILSDVSWCQRTGGVRLTGIELFILKHSFRFRRVKDSA